MKKKVIEILIKQIDDYCHGICCGECACYTYNQFCLLCILKDYKNQPTQIIKYLYSLDEGREARNNEKD